MKDLFSWDALDEHIKEQVEKDAFSGLVRIQRKEEILYQGAFGLANRTWGIKPTVDTKYRIASISKIFTAVAIGQIMDTGRLSLQDSVVDVLELTDTSIAPTVSIGHLLTHSSGIGDYFDEMNASDEDWFALWRDKPIYEMKRLDDYYQMFKKKQAQFSPGEKFQYCGAGYILLGMVIEKLTGQDYRKWIQREIFDRLDMKETAFLDYEDVVVGVADGYEPEEDAEGNIMGWKKNIYTMTPLPSADGGATSTLGDLIRFSQALRKGELMSKKMTALFLKPHVLDQDSDGFRDYQWKYGFANWFLLKEDQVVRMGHTGEEFGVSARLYYYPQEEIDVVLLGNQGFCTGSLGWKIHEMIVEEKS